MLAMTLMNVMKGVIVNMMVIMNIIINIMLMTTTFVPYIHAVIHQIAMIVLRCYV